MIISKLYNLIKQKAVFFCLFISILGLSFVQVLPAKAQSAFEKAPYIMFDNNIHGMRLLWQNNSSCECNISIVNSNSKSQKEYKSIEILKLELFIYMK